MNFKRSSEPQAQGWKGGAMEEWKDKQMERLKIERMT
jgi:hypothetical protein